MATMAVAIISITTQMSAGMIPATSSWIAEMDVAAA